MAFKKKNGSKQDNDCCPAVQTVHKSHPYICLSDRLTNKRGEFMLYSALREGVPIIDASLQKLTRLLGTFQIKCRDEKCQSLADEFIKTVKVGSCGQGLYSFVNEYFLSLLTYGTAVGEIVTDGNGIYAVYNADIKDIELSFGSDPLHTVISVSDGHGGFSPVPYQELCFITVMNPDSSSPWGNSILKGLPFICDILLKIYNTIGVNFERIGNIRYAVTYKPQSESADKSSLKSRAKQVAEQWGKTMETGGPVKDFVAVGDVDIKVIGADNQILDSEIPVRQMLEQIVAKLGIPPFLLGLNWSSTERMSSQQSDILTSELEYYRNLLNPVLRKIISLFLRSRGFRDDFDIEWSFVTLQDELQQAQTDYYNAQAKSILSEIKED